MSRLGVIVGIAGFVVVAGIITALAQPSTATPAQPPPVSVTVPAYVPTTTDEVIYLVNGTGAKGATATYQTTTGTSQDSAYDGWGALEDFGSGAFVYLSVQNPSATGSVTCTISDDSGLIATNTSDAPYGIAECNGETS